MKAYITCPLTHTDKRVDLLSEIETLVKAKNLETFVVRKGTDTAKEIFETDYEQLKSSDLIIAEVSELSHGVGIEMGLSFSLGLKRMLLIQKGKEVTKLAQGMPNTIIIEYTGVEDLKKKIASVLDEICTSNIVISEN